MDTTSYSKRSHLADGCNPRGTIRPLLQFSGSPGGNPARGSHQRARRVLVCELKSASKEAPNSQIERLRRDDGFHRFDCAGPVCLSEPNNMVVRLRHPFRLYGVDDLFSLPPARSKRFQLSKRYVWEILRFGKWIFVSSIVYFLSSNFDRLYLAKVASFGVVGIYGIARSISDLMGASVLRLGSQVLFPLIASNSSLPRSALRQQLAGIRCKVLVSGSIRLFHNCRHGGFADQDFLRRTLPGSRLDVAFVDNRVLVFDLSLHQ